MAQLFQSLIDRINTESAITPEDIKEEIAQTIIACIQPIFKEITSGTNTILLENIIKEKLGLYCEIMPEWRVHINVSDTVMNPDFLEFPHALIQKALEDINEKDFSAIPPEEILRLLEELITDVCEKFLNTVIFSNPAFIKIIEHFIQTFDKNIALMTQPPIQMTLYETQASPSSESSSCKRPGMYL